MITGTERGILVHAPLVQSAKSAFRKTSHGMTRDGTFLVENGKIQRGIRNFRFN